jgi:hypothetical protein
VGREAVELDDEAVGGPPEVGLERVQVLVDEGPWQLVGIEEGQEAALEAAPGGGLDHPAFLDEPFEVRRAGALGYRSIRSAKGGRAREPQRLGALGGAGERVLVEDGGQVEEGAGGRGDRDPRRGR